MKLIVACSQYPPIRSGYAKVAYELSSFFEKRGHDVEILTEGNGCSRFGKIAMLDRKGRQILDKSYDLLQVIGPTPFFSEQVVKYAAKRNLPTVYSMSAFPGVSSYYHIPWGSIIDRLYKKFYLLRSMKLLDRVVFNTEDFAKYSKTIYDGSYEVIPNGVDKIKISSNRDPLQRRNNVILYVGQLRQYKGLPYLIHALKKLRDTGLDIVLDIAGGGPDRDRLDRLIGKLNLKGSVSIHGEVSDDQLDDLYRRASVFVLPSVSAESFGIVLLEAAARGLPVISSDLPGVREVVKELGGVTVPPKNVGALAATLQNFFFGNDREDKSRNDPMVLSRFLWEDIGREYLHLYEQVLGVRSEEKEELLYLTERLER